MGIWQEYDKNMVKILQECDKCLLLFEDVGPRGSAWPSELGSVPPTHKKCWSSCRLSMPFLSFPGPCQSGGIQLLNHQSYPPASAHTAGPAHGGSDSAECKGKHPCCWWGGPHSRILIKSICACSGPLQEVFSDQPHITGVSYDYDNNMTSIWLEYYMIMVIIWLVYLIVMTIIWQWK